PKPPIDPNPKPIVEPKPNFEPRTVAGIPIEMPFIETPMLQHVVAFSTDVPTKNLVSLNGDKLYTGSGPTFRILNPLTGQPRGQITSELPEGFVIAGQASGDSLIAYHPANPEVKRINHLSGQLTRIGNVLAGRRGEITCMALAPVQPFVAV